MMRVPHPNATVQADARVDHCSLVIARQRYLDELVPARSQRAHFETRDRSAPLRCGLWLVRGLRCSVPDAPRIPRRKQSTYRLQPARDRSWLRVATRRSPGVAGDRAPLL